MITVVSDNGILCQFLTFISIEGYLFSHEEELKFIFENGKPDIKSSLLNLCEMLMYNDIIIIVLLGKYLCTHEPTYLHKYINV